MANQSIWPEADAKLTERWLTGVSCPEIGRELGVSADAVVGRAHRIGLPRHPSVAHCNLPPPKPRNRSHRRIRPPCAEGGTLPKLRSVPQPAAVVVQPLPPLPPPLPRGVCQFIANDPRRGPWSFCDAPCCASGSPWCLKHEGLVYGPKPKLRAEVV